MNVHKCKATIVSVCQCIPICILMLLWDMRYINQKSNVLNSAVTVDDISYVCQMVEMTCNYFIAYPCKGAVDVKAKDLSHHCRLFTCNTRTKVTLWSWGNCCDAAHLMNTGRRTSYEYWELSTSYLLCGRAVRRLDSNMWMDEGIPPFITHFFPALNIHIFFSTV